MLQYQLKIKYCFHYQLLIYSKHEISFFEYKSNVYSRVKAQLRSLTLIYWKNLKLNGLILKGRKSDIFIEVSLKRCSSVRSVQLRSRCKPGQKIWWSNCSPCSRISFSVRSKNDVARPSWRRRSRTTISVMTSYLRCSYSRIKFGD